MVKRSETRRATAIVVYEARGTARQTSRGAKAARFLDFVI
jgi:hypothetical protein